MTRSASTLLKAHSPPPLSSGMVAALATVPFMEKFNVDTSGRVAEQFHVVRNPPAVGAVTVTLARTALASLGTPPWPVTWRRVPTPPTRRVAPIPSRVSTMRAGANGARPVGAAVGWATGTVVSPNAAAGSTVKLQLTLRAVVPAFTLYVPCVRI